MRRTASAAARVSATSDETENNPLPLCGLSFATALVLRINTSSAGIPTAPVGRAAESKSLVFPAMADAFGLPDKYCYAHYDDFFAERLDADSAILTPKMPHSLEDRAVKKAFIEAEGRCTCPKDLPYCVCGAVSYGKIINKKPIIATKEEQEENSRSKSAKLRIFERK